MEARLLEAVEQAVIATDVRGTIVFWNRCAEQLYGWSAAEVLGRSVTQVVPAATTRQQAREIMEALGRGESWHGEFEVSRKDGTTFTAMVTDSPLWVDGTVAGVVGVSSDVSERRRLRDALHASEQRFRTLFGSIDEGFCLAEMILDERGVPRDYRFLEVNALFEPMTGLVDAAGKTALELVPDLEPVWVETYARVGVDRQTLRFEQGSAAMGRWFDVFAVPVDPAPQFAIVFKDRTESRRAEQALRESEARFRAMADRLPLLVWQNGPDGSQEWVNQTFCDFFGVPREAMLADRWKALTEPGAGHRYVEDFETAVATRTPFRGQVKVRDGQGRWRWLESWAEPRYSGDGEYLGHLGVSADVSDRVEAEETLRRNHAFVSELTALVPGVMYVIDVQRSETVFVNQGAGEALGYSPAEIDDLGERFLTVVLHPDEASRFEAHLRDLDALPEGATAALEHRLRHRDDGWRWFSTRSVVLQRDDAARQVRVLGISTDISARKQAEAALRAEADLAAYRARLLDAFRSAGAPQQVQELACRLLGEHLRATAVHHVHGPERGRASTLTTGYSNGGGLLTGSHRLDDYGAAVMAELRSGRTVAVDDVTTDPRLTDDERAAATATGLLAYVLTPLAGASGPVDALLVHCDHPRAWTRDDLAIVEVTGERTWTAVEQARAYQAARTAHRRAELVADVISALDAVRDPVRQPQHLVDALVPRLGDFATVEVPADPDPLVALAHRDPRRVEGLRTLRRHHRLPPAAAGSLHHVAGGRPQLISRITPALVAEFAVDDRTGALLRELAQHSNMAVPLSLGDDRRAVLMVGLSDPGRHAYTRDDLTFLQEVSHRAEVILASTRARRREHDIAVRLQQALLPDHLVQHPRLDIAARYQAAGDMLEVGGDWYDTFSWPSGHVGFIVGDIAGHNLESAAAMGRLRAATAALAAHVPPDPAALLDAVNRFARGPDGTEFATAACIVLQPETGRLAYSSAGHPPALVLAADGGTTWLEDATTPPLAVSGEAHRRRARSIRPGSTVVLYSDGLVERRGESLEIGLRRLASVAAAAADRPGVTDTAEALAEHLIDELTGDRTTEDDIVLMCLRLT